MSKSKKSSLFQKISPDLLLSPGGMVIIFLSIFIEIIGIAVPWPVIGFVVQLPFQIILIILLITVAKLSIKSMIVPSIIEFFFPFLPSWLVMILIGSFID